MISRDCSSGVRCAATRSGFTAVELAVSMVIAGVAIMASLIVAHGMTNQMRRAHSRISAQDNARVAIDEITRTLRGAGSGTDYADGQDRFVYAGPFTVAMNANLQPLVDPAGTGSPAAIDLTLGNTSVPLDGNETYDPPATFSTGAETVVLTVDSNRDGTVSADDATDDEEETGSDNPNDYVLKQFVYGKTGNANSVTGTGLALLRGPSTDATAAPQPLFRYWVDDDNNSNTPPVLHGDTDGDGALSSTEAAALTAVPADELPLIERVDVVATAEPGKPVHDAEYPSTLLRSSVSFRNRSSTAAHVVGVVFNDADRDGVQDAGELGIRDVTIRSSNSVIAKTDVNGNYNFTLSPGIYTITEVDPTGYSSTTANQAQVTLAPSKYTRINFGDYSTVGTGRIVGTVFADRDGNGTLDTGERGISGVRVFLDTGSSVYTNSVGHYALSVRTQDYVVTEVDSVNYSSTTPNVVNVNVANNGDSVVVNFGDQLISNSGTIHGIVYRDDNNDGTMNGTEPGVPNASIALDNGATTATDSRGEFTFTAAPGTHAVTETDPAGYTSSTLNTVNVTVVTHQTVEVRFGDLAAHDVSFQEISLGSTDRALSIASLDTGEDTKSDKDLLLGTHYVGGRNDVLVWWNNRTNASTPNSALFTTTPSYQRVIAADVNAIAVPDLDGDGRQDAIAALGTTSSNLAVWLTTSTGSHKGELPSSPTQMYTASGALSANDLVTGTFDADTRLDLAVGTRTGTGTGRVEIWHGGGGATFSRNTNDVISIVPGTTTALGEVVALAAADFTGDGHTDLVVGARTGTNASVVYLLAYGPGIVPLSDFYLVSSFAIVGSLNDLAVVDMGEDGSHDIDIIAAVETATNAGRLELWLNRGNNHFGQGEVPDLLADDTADPGGSPLSLTIANVDSDVFPDVVVGIRIGPYSGKAVVFRGFGYLPTSPTVISSTDVGEVITVTSSDYNKDGAPDIAVGTRNSATSGKVVIYYNQPPVL